MRPILIIIAALLWIQSTQAQPATKAQIREIHLLNADRGYTRIVLRFPMMLAYANELSVRPAGADLTGPFLGNVLINGEQFEHIDNKMVFENYGGFVRFLLRDFEFSSNGLELTPEYLSFVIVDTRDTKGSSGPIQPGLFANLALFDRCISEFPDRPIIGDSLVLMSFHLPSVSLDDPLTIKHKAAPFAVLKNTGFETRITDHRNGRLKQLILKGPSFDTVTVAKKSVRALFYPD